jgi:hypothetical protein
VRRARLAGFALVLVVCAAVWLGIGRDTGPLASGPSGNNPAGALPPVALPAMRAADAQAGSVSSSGRAGRQSQMVLPPQDAPLATELPALERAARQGDPGAMCRLSFELHRCNVKLRDMRRAVEQLSDGLVDMEPGAGYDGMLAYVAKQTRERDVAEQVCAGVTLPTDLKPWRLLRDAARAGHVPSMRRFATSLPIDRQHYFDDLEALVSFRDESAGFLQRAAEQGDPQAGMALVNVYSGENPMLAAGQIPQDPRLALAYVLALRGSGNHIIEKALKQAEVRMRRRLTKQEQQEAEKVGSDLAPRFAAWRGPPLSFSTSPNQTAEECGVELTNP